LFGSLKLATVIGDVDGSLFHGSDGLGYRVEYASFGRMAKPKEILEAKSKSRNLNVKESC